MAAVDKIYATREQYEEFRSWAKINRPSILKYFYMYDGVQDKWETGKRRPITNFPERVDEWLLKNCPIAWVIDAIKWQYNME